MKKYKIVLADPPWSHYGDPNKDAAAGKHYTLMSQQDLACLPVRSIMEKRSALFLWATGPRLDFAIDMIRSWRLHYRGVAYVWVKTRRDGKIISGQGIPPTFTKPTTEFCPLSNHNGNGAGIPNHEFQSAASSPSTAGST